MPRRDDDRIGDDVVDIVRAQRSRVSQVVDLDGAGAEGKYSRAPAGGVSREVDCDIDFELPKQFGRPEVAQALDIVELIERHAQSFAHRAGMAGLQGQRDGLESTAIVVFE